jgi:hypothetical protein
VRRQRRKEPHKVPSTKYAVCNRTDESPPQDGQQVSVRTYHPETMDDPRDYEVLVEDLPPDVEEAVWDGAAGTLRAGTTTEELAEAKRLKEAELRDTADAWYQANVRSFEGAIVTAKYGRSGLTALSAEERVVFDEMNANYTKLKNLIGQVTQWTT